MKKITLSIFLFVYSLSLPLFALSAQCVPIAKNLRKGSENDEVFQLQRFLYDYGYLVVTPNGYFGNATIVALKKFQKDNGIQQTGTTGPLTRKILNESCKSVPGTAPLSEQTSTSSAPVKKTVTSVQQVPVTVQDAPYEEITFNRVNFTKGEYVTPEISIYKGEKSITPGYEGYYFLVETKTTDFVSGRGGGMVIYNVTCQDGLEVKMMLRGNTCSSFGTEVEFNYNKKGQGKGSIPFYVKGKGKVTFSFYVTSPLDTSSGEIKSSVITSKKISFNID